MSSLNGAFSTTKFLAYLKGAMTSFPVAGLFYGFVMWKIESGKLEKNNLNSVQGEP
jgi:hypothetical protein